MALSQSASTTSEEKATMELVTTLKGGQLLKRNKTLYFTRPSENTGNSYDISLLDFLLEWGNTPLLLTPEQRAVVKASGDKNFIPLRCEFRNGRTYDYCVLLFSNLPPQAEWFLNKQPEWHYLTEVVSMELSPQAVPLAVVDEVGKVEKHNKRILNKIMKLKGNLLENPEYDKIRSQTKVAVFQDKSGHLFKFSQQEKFIYSSTIDAQTLTVVKNPTHQQAESARELALIDYNERGNIKPPFPTVYVLADAEI
jgi:hypothetical protein